MSAASDRANRLIAEARTWLGTPYRNCEDVKGAGVDCGMLMVRVAVDTGFAAPFDPRPYSPSWHLHQDGELYLSFIEPYCDLVDAPEFGGVIVWKVGRCFAHGAWVSNVKPLTIIHAWSARKKVVEERVHCVAKLARPRRERLYYRLKD